MAFNYSAQFLNHAIVCKSAPRLTKYLAAGQGNQADALALYAWNTAISAAFYGPLQALEICLRNAFDRELATHFGAVWWQNAGFLLTSFIATSVQDAIDGLVRENRTVDTPHVIAALSFGFWSGLCGPGKANAHDQHIWRPALHKAFAAGANRKDIFIKLTDIRKLRNRIAHHEPIFMRNLSDDYLNVLSLVTSLYPDILPWVEHHSRVPDILAARPSADKF